MARVYLRADENEAGVTVEDWAGDNVWLHGDGRFGDGIVLTDVQARAVVEGLLRRMLERDGAMSERDVDAFKKVLRYVGEGR